MSCVPSKEQCLSTEKRNSFYVLFRSSAPQSSIAGPRRFHKVNKLPLGTKIGAFSGYRQKIIKQQTFYECSFAYPIFFQLKPIAEPPFQKVDQRQTLIQCGSTFWQDSERFQSQHECLDSTVNWDTGLIFFFRSQRLCWQLEIYYV